MDSNGPLTNHVFCLQLQIYLCSTIQPEKEVLVDFMTHPPEEFE